MSTLVPMEASGGMMLHPGPGPLAAGPGPLPARATSPSPRSSLPCAEAVLVRSIVPSVIAERQATVFRSKLPPSERIKSIEPPFSQNRSEDVCGHLSTRYVQITAVTRLSEQPQDLTNYKYQSPVHLFPGRLRPARWIDAGLIEQSDDISLEALEGGLGDSLMCSGQLVCHSRS